jgi:hypothetical protein
MPNIYFSLFELIVYLQLALCLQHAWKQGTANLLRLLAGILFGVALELATIRQLNAYEYGQFLIMVLDVPLCIGSHGVASSTAMEFSDASSLPTGRVRSLTVARPEYRLALGAVAISLGFWDWGQGLDFQYFGVPYANFWGWFWVVFSFSLGYRLLARRADWIGTWLSPLLALILGLAGVLGTNAFIVFVVPLGYRGLTVLVTLTLAFLSVTALRPHFHLTSVPALVFWVPLLAHLYAFIAGVISGVILNPPFLLLVSLLMIAVAFYLHRPTIQHVLPLKAKPIE